MPRTNGKYAPAPADPLQLRNEQTGEQRPGEIGTMFPMYGNPTVLFANGGSPTNPMGFPGYDYLYWRTYDTYRWMLKHPVLALVRAICTDVIRASSWEYAATRDGVPDSWIALVKENLNRLRIDLIDLFVRARDFGWYGAELVWGYERGRYWIEAVKPLLPEKTNVLRDDFGNFSGLRNHVVPKNANISYIDLTAPYKAWKYSYDAEAGYHYGNSWLESVRDTAWKDWLDCAQQLQKIGSKIAGMVTIIRSPAGTFKGGKDGKEDIAYKSSAEAAIRALRDGAPGLWWPSLALAPDGRGGLDAMKVLIELAKTSLNNIEVVDFSQNSAAIGPILERMKHAEELMFNGGKRSSRTGLEAKHGTKEEAGVHTDTGTVNAEQEDEHFAVCGCQSLVDAILTINVGEQARGAVRIKPPSLIDRKTSIIRAIILAGMNNPAVAEEMMAVMDVKTGLSVLDVTTKKDYDPAAVRAAQEKQQSAAKTPEPQGGRPANAA